MNTISCRCRTGSRYASMIRRDAHSRPNATGVVSQARRRTSLTSRAAFSSTGQTEPSSAPKSGPACSSSPPNPRRRLATWRLAWAPCQLAAATAGESRPASAQAQPEPRRRVARPVVSRRWMCPLTCRGPAPASGTTRTAAASLQCRRTCGAIRDHLAFEAERARRAKSPGDRRNDWLLPTRSAAGANTGAVAGRSGCSLSGYPWVR